jgi:BolA family transcriptional regulator, general stress-responsive regulator
MNGQATIPTAAALEQTLRQTLAPSHLEVFDESGAHAGHAGANGLGYGTHFRVHWRAFIRGQDPGGAAPACV